MITILVEPGQIAAGSCIVPAEGERHHLRVRRVENGARVRVVDGSGGWGEGRIAGTGPDAGIEVATAGQDPVPDGLWLLVGAGDRDRFGWMVEKSGELGVTDVVPLVTDRVRSVATRVRSAHIDPMSRRAREAIKQSGATWAPRIHGMSDWDVLGALPDARRWVADPGGSEPDDVLAEGTVVTVVGPEGGLTGDELGLCERSGFRRVSLGGGVLRFETAALAAAVAIGLARRRFHG